MFSGCNNSNWGSDNSRSSHRLGHSTSVNRAGDWLMKYYSTSHDFNGRKVKKKKMLGGERFQKHPTQEFKPMPDAPVRALRGDTSQYKSADSDQRGVCSAPEKHAYTGTLIKGISCMHKSNAVPVLNNQEIIDIARMRR